MRDAKNNQPEPLSFNVSSGLKSVIGRDLITDDEVAIFELVKNSFDANAQKVELFFGDSNVVVLDDGDGMTFDEIKNKWLFVAYSSKKEKNQAQSDYRKNINNKKYAGSKGIGRFSSDRLGSVLKMQTKSRFEKNSQIHEVVVNWDLFEENDTNNFSTIPVKYAENNVFSLPKEMSVFKSGTAIEIKNTREMWDREKILRLKASLAKLINPFGNGSDNFKIKVISPKESFTDSDLFNQKNISDEGEYLNKIVNGDVGNFIFSTLKEKTTFNEVEVVDDGENILSSLIDRGELIYKIKEPNPFLDLIDSGFKGRLYYLNQSAKTTFARRMGIPSVRFGSVFLFRNGFRVYPVGEDGDDWFGIDKRKQQGYARYLGTRDVIGRVDVSGTEVQFKEASSRNQGLVDTPASKAMQKCFWDYCFKRLERYVVPVTWKDAGEKITDDLSILLTDAGRARVTSALAKLVESPEIEVLEYSKKLVSILNERSGQFEESLSDLRAIALKTSDTDFLFNLERAEKRFVELKKAESEAIRTAEEERKAKEIVQTQLVSVEKEKERIISFYNEEKKRNLFLTSLSSIDKESVVNMHHQITIYAADLKQQVENCIAASKAGEVSYTDLTSRLEQISFINQKILSVSRLATKANFRLESDKISEDLAAYVEQYITAIAQPYSGAGIRLKVLNNGELIKRFSPMEVSIFIDNLVSNSRKAGASEAIFDISQVDKKTLLIKVSDNGKGFSSDIEEYERIFDLGYSRTSGSGLGLYHVRQVLGEMKGSIKVVDHNGNAFFELRISQ